MKRVLSIQDISCLGKCSLTVALPIISAMGIETSIVPTAVLSTHTKFNNFTFRDLTDDMEGIKNHWLKEGFNFDAIYTGYIGEIDGYSIVLSQKYEGNGQGNYQSMSEVSEEELQNTYIIYDITMHGEEAFSAQNVDSREYAWSFIKSK